MATTLCIQCNGKGQTQGRDAISQRGPGGLTDIRMNMQQPNTTVPDQKCTGCGGTGIYNTF